MPDGLEMTAAKGHAGKPRKGHLGLHFVRSPEGRSYIARQFSSYPFHICRPFYLDRGACAGMATLYKQSCSGGVYSCDRLTAEIVVGKNAQAHVTSQSATIVHEATHGPAEQNFDIEARAGALVEYLPETTILFSGAHLKSRLALRLHETAGAILFDSFLGHDFRNDAAVFDRYENEIVVTGTDGVPLVIDRFEVTGEGYRDNRLGQMAQNRCHGSVLVIAPGVDTDALIDGARRALAAFPGIAAGVSALPGNRGFSVRILSPDAVPMKKAMLAVWVLSREAMAGAKPAPRRK